MSRILLAMVTALLLTAVASPAYAENVRVTVEILTYRRDEPLPEKRGQRFVVDDPETLAALQASARFVDRQLVQTAVVTGKPFEMMELKDLVTIQVAGRIEQRSGGKFHVGLRPAWREVSSQPAPRSGSIELDYDGVLGQTQIQGYLNRELAKGPRREFEYAVAVVTIDRLKAKEVQLSVEYFQLDIVTDEYEPPDHGPELRSLEAFLDLRERAKVRQHECISGVIELDSPYTLRSAQGPRSLSVAGKVVKHSDRLLRASAQILWRDATADRYRIDGRPLAIGDSKDVEVKLTLGQTVVLGGTNEVRKNGNKWELKYRVTLLRIDEVQ